MYGLNLRLIIFCGLTACVWSFLIPVWQYPDEQAHFAQVQNYAEYDGIPTGNDLSLEIFESERLLGTLRDDFGRNQYTNQSNFRIPLSNTRYGYEEDYLNTLPRQSRTTYVKQEATRYPPLYYILGGFFYSQGINSGIFTRVLIVRIVSVLLFTLLIASVFDIAESLFGKKNRYLHYALAAMIGLFPMLMFVGSGVNNDILVILVGTLLIASCLKILIMPLESIDLFKIGLFCLLGMASKQLIYPLFPAVALALIFSLIRNRPSKKIIWSLIIISLLSFCFFLIFSRFNQGFWLPYWPKSQHSLSDWTSTLLSVLERVYRETLPWYFGVYRWLGVVLPLWLLRLIKVLMLMAVVGWIIKIYKNRHYIDWKRHIHWIWLGLANIIYFSLLIAWETTSTLQLGFGHGLQGRYFFILVSSHFAFLLAGWWWIFNEFLKPKTFAILLTGIFLIFNLFSLKHVLGAYYDFYPLKTFLLEVSQYKPEIAKWPNNLIIIIIWIISLISLLRSFKKMKNSFSK